MANLKLEEKRTTNHKMKLESTLIIEDGLLTLVQYNDYDEVVRYKVLDQALVNFLNKDVKISIQEAEAEEEEIEHEPDMVD